MGSPLLTSRKSRGDLPVIRESIPNAPVYVLVDQINQEGVLDRLETIWAGLPIVGQTACAMLRLKVPCLEDADELILQDLATLSATH